MFLVLGALTLTKITDSFAILKNLVLEARASVGGKRLDDDVDEGPAARQRSQAAEEALCKQVRDLHSQILQRDTEINILVNMVKQGKTSQDVDSGSGGGRNSNKHTSDQFSDEKRSASFEKSSQKPPQQSQSELKMQNDRAKLIQRHLFGVSPPDDPRIFEDAAGDFESLNIFQHI